MQEPVCVDGPLPRRIAFLDGPWTRSRARIGLVFTHEGDPLS